MIIDEDTDKINWLKSVDIPNLVCMVVTIIAFIAANYVPVKQLYVPENDSLSSFPYPGKEQISTIVCAVIVIVIGIVLIIAFYFISWKVKRYFNQFNPFTAVYTFITVIAVTNVCVNIFKSYVGRPRPDLYARCGTGASINNCPGQTKKVAKDEFKSFPSGHSATAMSGLFFIALFIQKCVKTRKLWVTTLCFLFILLAFYIGATRIRDYKHHTDDVLAGFFVGFLFCYIIWWRTYKEIFPKHKKQKKEIKDEQTNSA